MIGNDVVDLDLASRQSNWRRKGFLQKVFSPEEQDLITTSKDRDGMVWLLWSMKESAYKAHQRQLGLPRNLNWHAQECKILDLASGIASGKVEISGEFYFTSSEITEDYIYTFSEKNPHSGVKNGIFRASSSEVKQKLIKQVSHHFRMQIDSFELKKDHRRMPFLAGKNGFLFDHFSLSGHGKFYAYSLSLINCETSVKQS
jgi:phosphopantetheinyl transferase (holo-ACP synthase)